MCVLHPAIIGLKSFQNIKYLNFECVASYKLHVAIYQSSSVLPHYDSLIAKLITFGDNRIDCIQKMKRALEEYIIMGIDTNIQLHQIIIQSDEFLSGNYNINFISKFQ